MNRISIFTGVLVLFALPLVCHAQEAGDAATDTPPAKPVMPMEVTFESSIGNVLFPHSVHLKFGCIACHHQIHADALETPHPDYLESAKINCDTCHGEGEAVQNPYYKCSNCHHSEPENIADETLSAKVVVHKSCWKCHKSGTGVEASKGCGDCHVKEEQQPEVSDG